MRRALLAAGAALLVGTGCGAAGPAPAPGRSLHRAKCSSCHVRPDPSRLDRTRWQAVLQAHRGRLHLDDREWRELLDFLGGR